MNVLTTGCSTDVRLRGAMTAGIFTGKESKCSERGGAKFLEELDVCPPLSLSQ